MKGDFKNASESFKRRNPHLFGAVGGLQDSIPKPDPIPALDQKSKACKRSARGVVIGVHIISVRKRILDSDNMQAGSKGLRDAIAETLGCDDADARLQWEYHQIKTTGREGTIVNIQQLT